MQTCIFDVSHIMLLFLCCVVPGRVEERMFKIKLSLEKSELVELKINGVLGNLAFFTPLKSLSRAPLDSYGLLNE